MPELFSPPSSSLTPASLFLLLNLVIGTIAIISRFTRKPPAEEERRPPFARSPSLIDRVRSFNLSFNRHAPVDLHMASYYQQSEFAEGVDRPPAIERSPSLLERLKSVNLSAMYRSEPELAGDSETEEPEAETAVESEFERPEVVHHRVERSQSEQVPAPERNEAEKLKRSASEKVAEEEGERVERRRPQTVRYEKTTSFGDEAVDAKADDFINKFKQQLKLQRLDSLLRYRDMLRGK